MEWEALEWTSLLGWHARAAAVLAVTVLATLALRGARPRLRHTVLAVGLIAAVVLPTIAAVSPVSWAVEVPTHPAAEPSKATLPELPAVAASELPALSSRPAVEADPIDWRSLLVGVWLAGALLGLGRAFVSGVGAWSLRRGAGAPSLELTAIHDAVQRRLGVRARLRVTPRIGVPIVVGVVHPTILLPREAIAWDAGRVRAVLLHELGHVAQADPRWFFAVHLVRAVLWVDPLAWIAARMFFREAEYSADDAALAGGIGAPDYAAELLALARLDLQAVPLVAAPALGKPVIGKRIRRVLQDPPTLVRLRRVVPVLLGALGGAAAVVVMRPVEPEPDQLATLIDQQVEPHSLRAQTVPLPANAPRVDIRSDAVEGIVGATTRIVLGTEGSLFKQREGHLIRPLFDLLQQDGQTHLPLLVRGEDDVSFETLVDVLYTAGRAGWRSYLLIVDVDGEERGVPLNPPTFPAESSGPEPQTVRVRWNGAGFLLETFPEGAGQCALPVRRPQVITRAAARMCELNGNRATPMIFAPAVDTPYAELVEMLAAAQRDCGGDNIIEAGAGSVVPEQPAPACDLDTFGE